MEYESVRRLRASRPKKGVKVIDLSARRVGPRKPEKKAWGGLYTDM
ncbi:MAG: hypothetical protein V3U09_06830 [Thermoplasmata archaeon]